MSRRVARDGDQPDAFVVAQGVRADGQVLGRHADVPVVGVVVAGKLAKRVEAHASRWVYRQAKRFDEWVVGVHDLTLRV